MFKLFNWNQVDNVLRALHERTENSQTTISYQIQLYGSCVVNWIRCEEPIRMAGLNRSHTQVFLFILDFIRQLFNVQ